jgi:conserved domain protein (fragment)
MTEKDIKPIPNYIMNEIYKRDLKIHPWQESMVRYYAYLTIWKKELVKVTVAVTTQKKQWCCKQVAVHGVNSSKCFVKDMEYNSFGYGYRVGWFTEELQPYQKRFEDGKWYTAYTKYYDPYAPLINRGVIAKIPEYKYSAYQHYTGRDIISYLRIYERFPQTEYMLKNGLCAYAENITLLKKFAKDKKFCKWFIRHRKELALPYGNTYNITTIREAYKTGRPLKEVRHFLFRKKQFERETRFNPIRQLFPGWKLKTYFDYTEKQNISDNLYLDYLKACNYLDVDMSKKQNLLPADFHKWHNIRIQQYSKAKAIAEAKNKPELMKKFAEVAEKYLPLQHNKRSAFICVIPKSIADLIHEGEMLHHCVGRMDYNERFAQEESLIFFVRTKEHPDQPLVTLEYSLQTHKVLQCHANRNAQPNDDILHYINKVWLPYANKTLKQIAA